MGEVGTSHCRDQELGGESMRASLAPFERLGDESLECASPSVGGEGRGCMLLEGRDPGLQSASDVAGAPVDRALVENGHQASREVAVKEQEGGRCSPSCRGNGAHVDIGKGFLGVEEEGGHLELEPAPSSGAPKLVTEEEKSDFPGMSPLRRSGGDPSAALFDDSRDCNGSENALFASPWAVAGCPLIYISRETDVRADGFCFPIPGECVASSTSCEASGIGESCENLLPLKSDKLSCSPCSGEMLGSSGGIMVESPLCSLQTRQGLSFEHIGTHNDHSEADAGAALEETGTSIQEDGKEEKYPCFRLEAEFGGSVRRSPDKIGISSAVEGSISLQASHLTSSVENCSSNLSMVQILHGNNSDSANGSSSCCKSGSLIVFRRSNPKRAASSRSSLNDRKPDQLTQIRNGARKCRKAIDTRTSFLDRIPSITRKRRSSRRLLHLSVWGSVENLIKYFEQNNDAIEIQNGRPEKGKCGLGKKKQQVARRVGSVRVSKTKFAASSNPAHVMDNRSPRPLFPVVVDSESSIQTRVDDSLANLDCKIRLGSAKKIDEVEHKLVEEMCSAGVNSLQCDGLRRDKDLESTLTQDTCVENILGECHGVSSRSGTAALVETVDVMHLLDRGTSPDSDVYHPIIDVGTSNSECATPTNQDAGRDQSVLVPEPVDHDGSRIGVLSYSEAFVIHAPVSLQQHTIPKKGKKNGEVNGCPRPVSVFLEEELNGFGNLSKAVKAVEWEKQGVDNGRSAVCSKSIRKATRKASTCKSFLVKSSLPGMTELEFCEDSVKPEFASENWALSGKDVGNAQNDAVTSVISLPTDKTKACKLPRSPKPGLSRGKSSCPDSERKRRQNVHGQRRENVWKSYSKSKIKEKSGTLDSCIKASGDMGLYLGTANKLHLTGTTDLSRKTDTGSKVVSVDGSSSVMDPVGVELASKECFHGLEGQFLRPRAAWVLCDDCHKWRCIPAELADIIDETNCKWTCKDNTDKTFADCSIPQEKTNAEINAELEISDASGEDNFSRAQTNFKGIEPLKLAASEPASWTVIKSNLFLHRNRKTQIIDEVMVCHCKAPSNGSLGCGEECLNRMLNIECVKGTCPCGNLCSNQKFQKRKYAKFKWFRCGKKGYGLQLQEDVSRGQFLIEYVGEVLDFATYEARQRYYASRGQKHFYFMTLNGGEVIDACAKGNLGRFINHSCDPNCRTEKWMINGEVCIGLFAIRDIKKGEEVTFDYNYVRVFGAAAKKCVCGSSECRGFIGGDPLNTEIIVQGDSDEEYLEPVMVHEDGEREIRIDVTVSSTINAKVLKPEQISKPSEDSSGKWPPTIPEAEVCLQIEDTSCRLLSNGHPLGISLQTFDPIQKEDTIDRPLSDAHVSENSSHSLNTIQSEETMCSIQPIEILCRPLSDVPSSEASLGTSTTVNESMSDSVLSNKESIVSTVQDKPNKSKPYRLAKSSRSSGTIKKGRACAKTWAPHQAKKMPTSTGSGHFEGVEEKLNDLLDEDGGISKRKDATKGYLKLLFVTAAEGDNVGGFAAKSTRDLSLILDALLKTKSRMVLVDIIVKNGLQMLHNIMKQNRGNFNRIPIIRKLLKVLEFLAQKGILTVEHINRGPPCSGMESFKDSILKLTSHNDIQVHQIARNFRDKWIPRNIRRVETSDREDGLLDSQRYHCNWHQSSSFKCRTDQGRRDTNAIICTTEAVHLPSSSCEADIPGETSLPSSQQVIFGPLTDTNPTSGSSTRKRKSRWDRPSDITSTDPQSVRPIGDQTVETGSKLMKPTTPAQLEQTSQLEVLKQKSETQKEGSSSCDETASTVNSIRENADDEAPPGFGSPRRDHRQIPSRTSLVAGDIVMGHRQERFLANLPVSYGMPVALMQQLGTPEAGGGQSRWAIAPGMPFYPFPPLPPGKPNLAAHGGKEETDIANRCHAAPHMDHSGLSSSGERPANYVDTGARNPRFAQRVRWPSHGSGRRDVRPQRWNNHRSHRWPPWSREGIDHDGSRGSSRNGASSITTGDPRRDNNVGFCFPECVSNHDVCSNFRQQAHHS